MKVTTTEHHLGLWRSSRACVLLEFKPQDLWIGAFWKRSEFHTLIMKGAMEDTVTPTLDIWICVIPMLPIHICRWGLTMGIAKVAPQPDATSEGK